MFFNLLFYTLLFIYVFSLCSNVKNNLLHIFICLNFTSNHSNVIAIFNLFCHFFTRILLAPSTFLPPYLIIFSYQFKKKNSFPFSYCFAFTISVLLVRHSCSLADSYICITSNSCLFIFSFLFLSIYFFKLYFFIIGHMTFLSSTLNSIPSPVLTIFFKITEVIFFVLICFERTELVEISQYTELPIFQ